MKRGAFGATIPGYGYIEGRRCGVSPEFSASPHYIQDEDGLRGLECHERPIRSTSTGVDSLGKLLDLTNKKWLVRASDPKTEVVDTLKECWFRTVSFLQQL